MILHLICKPLESGMRLSTFVEASMPSCSKQLLIILEVKSLVPNAENPLLLPAGKRLHLDTSSLRS